MKLRSLCVAVAALSLPGAAVMTLAGGAIFGLIAGTALVSFASSIGATLAFLSSHPQMFGLAVAQFLYMVAHNVYPTIFNWFQVYIGLPSPFHHHHHGREHEQQQRYDLRLSHSCHRAIG